MYTISPFQLLTGMLGAGPGDQDLPSHAQARLRDAGADATNLTRAQVDDRVAEIVHECLRTHGGWVDPSRISHQWLGLGSADERMYSRINKLLLPGEPRPFVERRPRACLATQEAEGHVDHLGPAAA